MVVFLFFAFSFSAANASICAFVAAIEAVGHAARMAAMAAELSGV